VETEYYSGTDVVDQEYHYLVITRDSTRIKVYDNGNMESDTADANAGVVLHVDMPSTGPYIGDYPGETEQVDGIVDELRISIVPRSADWIQTEYNNMNDTSTFYSVGNEEIIPVNWLYRKPITINASKVTGDLTDFPMLINIIDSDLKNKARSDGYDIVFTESDRITKLDHEIESYNGSSGELVAWVRVPVLSSITDMIIYMYYGNSEISSPTGNPSGVWSNGYEAVWHFGEESGSGAYINDSTGNGYDGTPTNTLYNSSGKIDGARSFRNDNDNRITFSNSLPLFDAWNNFTLEFWLYLDYVSNQDWDDSDIDGIDAILRMGTNPVRNGRTWYENDAWEGRVQVDFEFESGGAFRRFNNVPHQTWSHFVYTYDGVNVNLYKNGSLYWSEPKPNDALISSATIFVIGDTSDVFNGSIDELRISRNPHSAAWFSTQFNNTNDTSTFYTIGDEEIISVNWLYRKPITINASKVAGDLTDFPMLIQITDTDLKTKARSDGYDIIFTADDGWTRLDHEIERYNGSSGELVSWIRVPYLSSSSDTVIYMHYGNSGQIFPTENPSGVWDDNYTGVWHLNDDLLDSTSNDQDGINGGSTNASGMFADGQEFDDTNYVYVPDFSSTIINSTLTLSGWVNASTPDGSHDGYFGIRNGVDADFYVLRRSSGTEMEFRLRPSSGSSCTLVPFPQAISNQWHYLTLVYDGSDVRAYINGVQEGGIGSSSGYIINGSVDLFIGKDSNNNRMVGIIDEVRFSNISRSVAWIETEFNNQNDTRTFYTLGSEEQSGEEQSNNYCDVIVGAYGYGSDQGRAYIFYGRPGFTGEFSAENANVTINGSAPNDRLGWDVSSAGDVNNDGFRDVIIGAPGNNSDTGVAYIFYGNNSMPSLINDIDAPVTIVGGSAGDEFGYSLSFVDDLNNDSYDDVILGAPGNNSDTGVAYIFFGNNSMNSIINVTSANVIMLGESTGDKFGFSVHHAGDVNGDGLPDVIVGAPFRDDGPNLDAGAIYVFEGGTSMDNIVDWSFKGEQANDHLGWSVSYAGDINNDGQIDITVGAPDNDDGGLDAGKAYILTIMSTKPLITNVLATPSIQNIDGYVNITSSVTALNGVGSVWVNITLPSGGYSNISMTPGVGDQWFYYDNYSIPGLYQYVIWANDTLGNWTESGVYQFQVVNSPPLLSSPQVDTLTGYIDTEFNFTVTYTDLDNHPPNNITVNITGIGVYDLIEVDPSDTNYTDGKEYYYNTSGFSIGLYSFHFAANDTLGDWDETVEIPGLQIFNTPPVLLSPEVDPLSGTSTTSFNFTVNYMDLDDHPPGNITLNLTGPSGGTFNLMEVDPSDTNYSDGKEYYYNTTLSNGSYSFHFAANDSYGNWYETTEFNVPLVGVSRPIFTNIDVTPNSGYVDTWFNFTVNYSHPFDKGPDNITLNLTGPSGGIFDLIEVDPSDINYTDGKLYYYNRSSLAVGSYSFNFAANDTDGNWSESGISGFEVLNRDPILALDQVDPITGFPDTGFNFTVNYMDLDNHAPYNLTLNITGVGVYDLIEVDPLDTNYIDGKAYYYNASGFAVGSYTLHFAANDTIGNWAESGVLGFEVLNRDPILALDQVDPITGFTDTGFNFTVNYMDLDNQAPNNLTLNITGVGIFDIIEIDPLDTNYTDGKAYYYNASGFSVGSYSFHFAANDTIGNWTESSSQGFDVVNRPPILALGQVDPTSGYTDTWFNFTVNYMDLDNHVPEIITVNITGVDVYSLIELDPLDTDYKDGKEYYYNASGFAVGSYSFHFAANDTIGNWTESGILQFEVLNRDPMLSLEQVDPTSGYIDTWFNFTVNYTNLDDNSPDIITVNITGVGVYDLIEVDPSDTNYIDGKGYYYNISGFTVGSYSFHFAANDTFGNWTESGILQFDVINRSPTLSLEQVNPNSGYTDTGFNFTITYTDLDDHAPEMITLNISGVGVYDLIELDPSDTTYTDGKEYYYNVSGFALGQYSFHFAANDTIGNWTESNILQFDVINRVPTLSFGQVNPTVGDIDTWYNFTVTYTDLDNHPPDMTTLNITSIGVYDLIELDPLDIDYTDGKAYYYNTSGFAIGSYSFHFAANDTQGDWIETIIFNFDVIDRVPTLLFEQVDPSVGYTDTWFNFTVTYADLDNHAPDIITVNITGVGVYSLFALDPLDMDYTDGKVYYNNISGFAVGLHTFHFAANDTFGNWIESGILQFDVVNRAPTLSLGQVDPTVGYTDTWFNFTVIYTDLDNHAPYNITLNLSGLSGGIFDLLEVNPSDSDHTDGKEYYFNTTLTSDLYSFHFAANDSLGLWAIETMEINAPNVVPKHGVLYAVDFTKEYSDDIYLNVTLLDDFNNPIPNENVVFYIDINKNGSYEAGEFAGIGTTLVDGSVSLIYTSNLSVGTYYFTAVYVGSGGFVVDDGEALLTIIAKGARLTATSDVVDEGEEIYLTAILMDNESEPVGNEQVAFYIDKNKNGLYEGGEFIGLTITSASGVASVSYTVNLIPESYGILARYLGSSNYAVSEIEGLFVVQNLGNIPPTITGIVPDQTKPEDSLPWALDLTTYEVDVEDSGPDLSWYLTGVNTSLYSVTGMNSSDDIFTFITVPDAFGNDEVILWLEDSSGAKVSQVLWVNITPVNDPPYFAPSPPNLYVHYDDPSTSEDDPSPWDYTFYVHDIETPVENLIITTSEPTVDTEYGYAEVEGLEVTFHYPQTMVGQSVLVFLTLSDGSDTAQAMILVNVTSNWVPERVDELPDVVLEENSTLYNVFDLDDYFIDKDEDSLYFSSGYFNIKVNINEDNTVDITALGQWTGSEFVTFRAEDPTGAIAEDTINVTVIPVNDPPEISGVPDLVVHHDYSYAFDLSPYISDPDNLTSELIVWTSELWDYIWLQQSNKLGIVVNYPESMNGTTIPVTIYVSDGIEIASQQIQITVTNNFPPELIFNLPDVFFDEDTILWNAFCLSDYFFDIDSDVLYYTNGTKFINATINENLTVDFSAPENWYGFEWVTFRATDPTGALAEDKILVVVVPVNDAPTIDSIPRQEKEEGDQWVLDLSQYIGDVDNNASELIITIRSEVGMDYVTLVGNILIFQYPEGVRDDVISITVSDGELEASRSFIVDIKTSEQVVPTIWDLIPWPWVFLFLITGIGGAFAFYKKKSKYLVYEAFLIHENGLPMAHVSHEESSELEDVVVSGMFTAVQNFINDTFSDKSSEDDWELDEMKFGDHKILIERSQILFLAVIFEGYASKLRKRVKRLLHEINEEYGSTLKDWDGDMARLKGIRAMVASLVSKDKDKDTGAKPLPAHSETHGEEFKDALMEWEDTKKVGVEELGEYIESIDKDLPEVVDGEVVKAVEIEVIKCPVCGKDIQAKASKCPRCGIEFVEIKDVFTSSSLKPENEESKN